MDTLARHRSCFGRRGHPKIKTRENAKEEGSLAAVESESRPPVGKFWGDDLGLRNKNIRVVYNNVNGLRIGEFISTKIKNEVNRKK